MSKTTTFGKLPRNAYFRYDGLPYQKLGSARAALSYKRDELSAWGRSSAFLRDMDPMATVTVLAEAEACGRDDPADPRARREWLPHEIR